MDDLNIIGLNDDSEKFFSFLFLINFNFQCFENLFIFFSFSNNIIHNKPDYKSFEIFYEDLKKYFEYLLKTLSRAKWIVVYC